MAGTSVPPWRVGRAESDVITVVSVFVETLAHTIEDVIVRDNILMRVRERGTILSMTASDDEMFFRMATCTQCQRVCSRTEGVEIMGGTIKLRCWHLNKHIKTNI